MIAGKNCGAKTTNGLYRSTGVSPDAQGCLKHCIDHDDILIVPRTWADATDSCCTARCSSHGCLCNLYVEGYQVLQNGDNGKYYGPVELFDAPSSDWAVLRSMIDPATSTVEPKTTAPNESKQTTNEPADVDCEGTFSVCSAACEKAGERVWTETMAKSGNGKDCPDAEDCIPGDGACVGNILTEIPENEVTAFDINHASFSD